MQPRDFADADLIYQIGVPPAQVEILTYITGVNFTDAWTRRKKADFDGVPAHFIGVRDLLANKRSAGRLSDLADCERLEEALNE